MRVNLYRSNGGIEQHHHDSPASADVMFNSWKPLVRNPFGRVYRVTMTDPLAGDRVVRDTDSECGIGVLR